MNVYTFSSKDTQITCTSINVTNMIMRIVGSTLQQAKEMIADADKGKSIAVLSLVSADKDLTFKRMN